MTLAIIYSVPLKLDKNFIHYLVAISTDQYRVLSFMPKSNKLAGPS